MRPEQPSVTSITSARISQSEDRHQRMRTYVILMGIRTSCFILAAVLPLPWPLRALLMAGAVLLPYVAVVLANAGGERTAPGPAPFVPAPTTAAITAAPHDGSSDRS